VKFLPALVGLFFVLFLIVSSMIFMKLESLDQRLVNVPVAAEVDERFQGLETRIESIRNESFKSALTIYERLTALETGSAQTVSSGPKTKEFLLTALKQDFLTFQNIAGGDPDGEQNLQERLATTLDSLGQRQEGGADVVADMFRELQISTDCEWKAYLLREAIPSLGRAGRSPMMEYLRHAENDESLRVLAARSVPTIGTRQDLRELAGYLEDREESLVVKIGLARIFKEHPSSAAEEGLIEGVRGVQIEGSDEFEFYHPEYRYACLEALGRLDSPLTIRFLEELLFNTCAPGDDPKANPYIPLLAIDAYHAIKKEEALPYLEQLLEDYALFEDPLGKKIQNILKLYENDEGSGEQR